MSELTFDQLIFKASHNSYLRDESLQQQLTFNASKPYNCGCMGIELDIWRHSSDYTPYGSISAGYFTVAHSSPGDTALSLYLQEVLQWWIIYPTRDVVLITLDIKSSDGGFDNFQDEIDTYLYCWFNEKLIFKPGSLLQNPGLTLCQNVIATGWPARSELKGKFIFCLSGNKEWKAKYAATDLPQRYCFSDRDESDSDRKVKPPTTGNIVFFNFNINHDYRATWTKTIPPFATKKLITRSYVSNSEANWNDCIKANVSAIATDKISNNAWCKVSDTAEYRQKSQ
jgi:Phosphoinositide phospholipase C, Ca2+-dependent